MSRREVPANIRSLVVQVDTSALNVTEFCSRHGISTWFFWDLRRRYRTQGDSALEPRSRAPRRIANRTPVDLEDAIVALRKELVDAGLDAGPATIAYHLGHLTEIPGESTIWRILKRRGFITPEPSKAPKRSMRRFAAERPNECWQIDDTGWPLTDGTEIKIVDVIDDCTRLAVASQAFGSATTSAALEAMAIGATRWGWPQRFLSDNAQSYRHGLADSLGAIGVGATHSRPYHPQTCGKVERFHQTLKKWLAKQPGAPTLDHLQTQLDNFVTVYNHHRPHRSINRATPADTWQSIPKAGPATYPIGPTCLYTKTVHRGAIWVGRYRISIGAAFNGQTATAITTGTTCHIFVNGKPARTLTINPDHQHQKLHNNPGRPKQLP